MFHYSTVVYFNVVQVTLVLVLVFELKMVDQFALGNSTYYLLQCMCQLLSFNKILCYILSIFQSFKYVAYVSVRLL